MRLFVIVSPGLSVAKPGALVDDADLRMTDDQLDEFVEAGYATEIFTDDSPPLAGRYDPDDIPDDVALEDL